MDPYVSRSGKTDDPELEAIVMEGRCEGCEEPLGLLAHLMGKTLCSDCAKERTRSPKPTSKLSRS